MITTDSPNPDWSFLYRTSYEERLQSYWTQKLWEAIARFIPERTRTLEIGSGPGAITALLAKLRGCRSIGLDISEEAVRYAQGLARFIGSKAEFVRGDAFRLPFSDNSFDVVFSTGVIEHWPEKQTFSSVKEHARVVKPGGLVIISVPNLLNLPLTYHKIRTGKRFHAYPERSYTIWGLRSLVRKAGLTPLTCSGFAPSISLEWYIWAGLKLPWLDNLRCDWLMALIGYEVLVVAKKPSTRLET